MKLHTLNALMKSPKSKTEGLLSYPSVFTLICGSSDLKSGTLGSFFAQKTVTFSAVSCETTTGKILSCLHISLKPCAVIYK